MSPPAFAARGASAPTVSVLIISRRSRPARTEIVSAIGAQHFVHDVEIVVAREERDPELGPWLERAGARTVDFSSDRLVARSLQDGAASACRGEITVLLASDLDPQGAGWLDALVGPLLEDQGLVATRGVVRAAPGVAPYDAYRFEADRSDPFDFLAYRTDVVQTHSFHASGNLGHRWLERLRALGEVRVVDGAVAFGRSGLPEAFDELVAASKRPVAVRTLPGLLVDAARDMLGDWEALSQRKLERPAPVYVRAALVRLAEMLGRSRFRPFF